MRIVAGRHRSRVLESPADRRVRPTADRVREALFSILGPERIADAVVLDAFAGSGAIGLEALSRGAAACTFLDLDAAALGLIRRNVEALGEVARARVLKLDATRPGPAERQHALALLDPPYGSGLAPRALENLAKAGWLAEGARITVELAAEEAFTPPPDFRPVDERRYGAARILILDWEGRLR
ncbi:MAG: 16S rRNA (guanine(966)-N(2))-methyltransferase RsmD [Alphaproteobacteria bacterium]|nr:16S rRNA (guanine(966)-N(2))-methyltransferase RsmD [Alphaproteobacteria bacterium]